MSFKLKLNLDLPDVQVIVNALKSQPWDQVNHIIQIFVFESEKQVKEFKAEQQKEEQVKLNESDVSEVQQSQ